MKSFAVLVALLNVAFASPVFGAPAFQFDGCYYADSGGTAVGSICLDGVNETGANGSGVRLAFFDKYGNLNKCFLSAASMVDSTSFQFYLPGHLLVLLENATVRDGVKEANGFVNNYPRFFTAASDADAQRMTQMMRGCQYRSFTSAN